MKSEYRVVLNDLFDFFIARLPTCLRHRWLWRQRQGMIVRLEWPVLLRKFRNLMYDVRKKDILEAYKKNMFQGIDILSSVERVIRRRGWVSSKQFQPILNERCKYHSFLDDNSSIIFKIENNRVCSLTRFDSRGLYGTDGQ